MLDQGTHQGPECCIVELARRGERVPAWSGGYRDVSVRLALGGRAAGISREAHVATNGCSSRDSPQSPTVPPDELLATQPSATMILIHELPGVCNELPATNIRIVAALHSTLHRDPMQGETGAGGPSGLPSCG